MISRKNLYLQTARFRVSDFIEQLLGESHAEVRGKHERMVQDSLGRGSLLGVLRQGGLHET
jgi:hypothetical protein